jgi:MerR family transcriptional regulator, copper efflux regulator
MLQLELSLLKIGELSSQSGVPVKTIRYYEELGLITAIDRTEGQFRLFHPNIISRLRFIKQLQGLGLSLREIGECLVIHDAGQLPCGDIQSKLTSHVQEIDRQVTDLLLLRQELTNILEKWQASPVPESGKICPNLQT